MNQYPNNPIFGEPGQPKSGLDSPQPEFAVGERVGLLPHLDLWMAGVRFGNVTERRRSADTGAWMYLVDTDARAYWLYGGSLKHLVDSPALTEEMRRHEEAVAVHNALDYVPGATGSTTVSSTLTDGSVEIAAALVAAELGGVEIREPHTVELGGWWDLSKDKERGVVMRKVVGEMIRLGGPVIKQFHGDHISDYEWLMNFDNVGNWDHTKPVPAFTFLVRHSGTHIGAMADAYLRTAHGDPTVVAWTVQIHPSENFTDRGTPDKHWSATFTPVGE